MFAQKSPSPINARSDAQPAVTHQEMANAIRALAMDAVEAAQSGHPGMPMGMADVATVLFADILKYDPRHPQWPDRDRFVLSAGHGSMLQYALLYLTGYDDMTIEELRRFRQLGSKTAGHPEYGHAQGIETTTGPLGQGLANGVGMALAERALNAEFGDELVDHRTYVIAGDGCLMEGISHEAASLAGHLGLNKLIVLFDDNGISIDGPTDLAVSDDHLARFAAYGWATRRINGHDPAAIAEALFNARASDKPTLIACKTTIAYGAPTKGGTAGSHGAPLGAEEIAATREQLGWSYAPFEVPESILSAWREVGGQGAAAFVEWTARLGQSPAADAFTQRIGGELPEGWQEAIRKLKQQLAEQQPKEATRKSSQQVLDAITPHIPALIGGSADLTGSNNTKAGPMQPITADNYSGRYMYYGVREHAMAAAMNGLALHGGFIPYAGTFLVFSDYMRPAMRLAGLMGQRVIYVLTHDSIGLGEDGPTHQPVEHLSSLRAMPGIDVYRPADASETAESWALALAEQSRPSVIALSRQGVAHLRPDYTAENPCARGAYVLRDAPSLSGKTSAEGAGEITLIATGSEVSVAVEAQAQLAEASISARVVSMPCWELFERQPAAYQREVLGEHTRKVAIEAGIRHGWDRFIGPDGLFIGMAGFGASAPAGDLFRHFGITAEAVVEAVKTKLSSN